MTQGPAAAHVLMPGVSGLGSLVLHPFAGIESVLVLAALAAVVGASERLALVWLSCLAALVGGMLGALAQRDAILVPGLWRLPLVVAGTVGGAAALGWRPRLWSGLAVAFLAAVTIGAGLTPEKAGLIGMVEAGIAAAIATAIVLLAVALPRALARHRAVHLAGRIVGAWVLAIAMLGLSISLR